MPFLVGKVLPKEVLTLLSLAAITLTLRNLKPRGTQCDRTLIHEVVRQIRGSSMMAKARLQSRTYSIHSWREWSPRGAVLIFCAIAPDAAARSCEGRLPRSWIIV